MIIKINKPKKTNYIRDFLIGMFVSIGWAAILYYMALNF